MSLTITGRSIGTKWRQGSLVHIWSLGVLGLIVLGFLVNGCTMVGPDFVRPEAPLEDEWLEADDARVKSEPSDYSDWWTVFNDHTLNFLIEKAYRQNLSLRIAGLRILEARAELGIIVGDLYPQQQQSRGEITRTGVSDNQANTSKSMDSSYWDYSVGFDAAWELDVWGKFRRAVESGVANVEVSIADYDDSLVSLTAEVSRTYVIIRTLENRLLVTQENVRIQEESLRIATARFKGGLVSELDVQQARTLLAETRASIPQLKTDLRQAKNALAILLGMLPNEVDTVLGRPGPIPSVPVEVVVDIPAELLRRRPDIRLTELQIAAQTPLVGVAKADLYPHFELLGSVGLRSSDSPNTIAGGSSFSDLFDLDSIEFSAGPSIRWDFFNYGRLKNQVRVEDARLEQLIVNYQDTVLKAQQDVQDALVAFLRSQEEETYLANGVKASKRSVELSQLQYLDGLVDYQRVLDAQRSLVVLEDSLTETAGSVATNLIAMYKALGGGWQIRKGKEFVSPGIKEEMRERTDWGKLLDPAEVEPPSSDEARKKWRRPDW
jgi:NodT family efflux transporter outer membrane factor (OMF) lipoprotein